MRPQRAHACLSATVLPAGCRRACVGSHSLWSIVLCCHPTLFIDSSRLWGMVLGG